MVVEIVFNNEIQIFFFSKGENMVKYTKELPCNKNGKWPSSRVWFIEIKNIIYFNVYIYGII
jgi:hypothetical protein